MDMIKVTRKFNILFTMLMLVFIFSQLYYDNLFPFSNYVTLDLASNSRLATKNFLEFEIKQWTHENYYPRLFFIPFYALFKFFGLSSGHISAMMFFTMLVSLIFSSYYVYEKLKGNSLGLSLVPLLITNGNFAHVIGIFFLLYLIKKPTKKRILILGLGYPHLVMFILPYLYLIKNKSTTLLGAFLILSQLSITQTSQKYLFSWNGFNPSIRGFNPYIFSVAITLFLVFYAYTLLITRGERIEHALPLTVLLITLAMITLQVNLYWIVKTLVLFPLFVTISSPDQKVMS